ncbi:MAG TPA: mycofactocin radical SAM maturase, partial [Frankiaceae bacterium]|nr:mycofactocin radical SAM maturase [Frankiaceae bacterium]
KFFTGLPLDGPDPECVLGHGERALAAAGGDGRTPPHPGPGHSRRSLPLTVVGRS